MQYLWRDPAHFTRWIDGLEHPLTVSEFKFPSIKDIGRAIGKTVGRVVRGAVGFAKKVLDSTVGRAAVIGMCSMMTANPIACKAGVEAVRRVLDLGGSPAQAASAAAEQPGGESAALAVTLTSRGGAGDPLAIPNRIFTWGAWWLWGWPGTNVWAIAPRYQGWSPTQSFASTHSDGSMQVSIAGAPWRSVTSITNAMQRG